jgi:hypothetical protein
MSTRQLRRELARRERGASRLISRRDALQRRLDTVLSELQELGHDVAGGARRGARRGRPPGRGRAAGRRPGRAGKRLRARNKVSLPEALAAATKPGATVTPAEAAQRIKAKGFKSTSANFGMMVSNALSKDKRFKRLERGKYQRVS